MQVEGQHGLSLLRPMATGARVSNTYPTSPTVADSPAKVGLIRYVVQYWHHGRTKDLSLWDGDASD